MIFFWVMLYPLTYTIAEMLAQALHLPHWTTSAAIVIYAILLVLWIRRAGMAHAVWLCRIRYFKFWDFLLLLPLFMLPIYNILTASGHDFALPTVILMLGVCTTEEIFFRGFLLRFFSKWGKLSGILLSSAVFALCHWVNLIHQPDMAYILAQVVCAFAVGICYSAVTVAYGSLIPAFSAHFLTNITGVSESAYAVSGWTALALWICITAYVCYGFWLCYKFR